MPSLADLQRVMQHQLKEDQHRQLVNVTAFTIEDAIRQAAAELSLPMGRIGYEIIERGRNGFLGLQKRPFLIMAYPSSVESQDADKATPQPKDRDGEVFVRLDTRGVMLKVTNPIGSGLWPSADGAIEKIRTRVQSAVDKDAITRIVDEADGKYYKIGEFDYDPRADANFSVELSNGNMKAWISVGRPGRGGSDPTAGAIKAFLKSKGIHEGLLEERLQRFEDEPRYSERILIAEGQRAIRGRDAYIALNFRRSSDRDNLELQEIDGRVDFKNLHIIQNVVAAQELARKHDAQTGVNGYTVTGEILPAEDGDDLDFQIGKNVSLGEDGRTAIADINGQVIYDRGRIQVEPVYMVSGDVNIKTGNILFLGSVVIKGNIDDGFSVKASGSIEVHGSVGKAELDCEEDIVVHRGIAGRKGATIRCGRSLWAKFIENATVRTNDMVVVSDGIINSLVLSRKRVICKGRRASIVGGRTLASELISAKTLGSVAGTETVVEVGYDPEIRQKLKLLQKNAQDIEEELQTIDQKVIPYKQMQAAGRPIDEQRADNYKRMIDREVELQYELKERREEIAKCEDYLRRIGIDGRVSISHSVFPGARIGIQDAHLDVRREFKSVTFVQDGSAVAATSYQKSADEEASLQTRARGVIRDRGR